MPRAPAAIKTAEYLYRAPRLRRAQIGTHHHFSGRYLGAYASEMAWREDNRRVSNGEQYIMATNAALKHGVSRQWKGYWQ